MRTAQCEFATVDVHARVCVFVSANNQLKCVHSGSIFYSLCLHPDSHSYTVKDIVLSTFKLHCLAVQ